MQFKLIYLAALTIGITSCNRNTEPELAPETIYNSKGQHVITSLFNNKLGNMSVLYGNAAALKYAGIVTTPGVTKNHVRGEIFTLVTWKAKPHPNWYGTNINGTLQTIERVTITPKSDGGTAFMYEKMPENEDVPQQHSTDSVERIHFIINQTASVYP